MMNRRKTAAFSALALLVVVATWWWLSRDWVTPVPEARTERPYPEHAAPAPPTPRPEPVAEAPAAADEASPAPPAEDVVPPPVAHATGQMCALSGRVVDARGKPLAGHIVRLSDPPGAIAGAGASTRTVEATSDADGRFTVDVRDGTSLLQLLGPGDGDIAILQRDRKREAGVGVGLSPDEGRAYLAVPPGGLQGLELVGPRHACFWVEGQLEPAGMAGAEPEHTYLITNGIQLRASMPDWGEVFDPLADTASDLEPAANDPTRVVLQVPRLGRGLERSFLVGADERSDTLLVVAVPGYATQTRKVQGDRLVEEVGTIVLERVAGLVVDVSDAATSHAVEQCSIELRETGGDQPDRVSVHEVRNDLQGDLPLRKTIWSERSSGHYELRIRCPGYADWTGSGELVLGDPDAKPPLVSARLEPAP